jgi:two-component system LytT family response regulator
MNQSTLVNAFITEDDPFFSAMLKDLLSENFPFVRICGESDSISGTRSFLQANKIDLLFLDVELSDGIGFDLISSMDSLGFEVIITTSHSGYMLDAIRHSALDYLLKPLALTDMKATMAKFSRKFFARIPEKAIEPMLKPVFQKIPLHTSDGFVFVNIDDIVQAEADRVYAVFSVKDGTKILVSKPLGDFEDRLLKNDFFRVHNSHIINLNEIKKYVRGDGGHVVMSNDAIVPVARSRKEDFLKVIGF